MQTEHLYQNKIDYFMQNCLIVSFLINAVKPIHLLEIRRGDVNFFYLFIIILLI